MNDRPTPTPAIPSLRDQVALHAAEIIPSVAVLELEGEQKRAKVREQIKARVFGQVGPDNAAMRKLVLDLLPVSGPVRMIAGFALRFVHLPTVVDASLDGAIQVSYRALKIARVVR